MLAYQNPAEVISMNLRYARIFSYDLKEWTTCDLPTISAERPEDVPVTYDLTVHRCGSYIRTFDNFARHWLTSVYMVNSGGPERISSLKCAHAFAAHTTGTLREPAIRIMAGDISCEIQKSVSGSWCVCTIDVSKTTATSTTGYDIVPDYKYTYIKPESDRGTRGMGLTKFCEFDGLIYTLWGSEGSLNIRHDLMHQINTNNEDLTCKDVQVIEPLVNAVYLFGHRKLRIYDKRMKNMHKMERPKLPRLTPVEDSLINPETVRISPIWKMTSHALSDTAIALATNDLIELIDIRVMQTCATVEYPVITYDLAGLYIL